MLPDPTEGGSRRSVAPHGSVEFKEKLRYLYLYSSGGGGSPVIIQSAFAVRSGFAAILNR